MGPTEKKSAESKSADETLLSSLVDNLQDYAVFLLNTEGVVLTWSHAAEQLSGWTHAEITGQHFSRLYLPEDLAAGKPEMELRVAAADGVYRETGWRLRKNGSRFWADVTLTALREENGELTRYGQVVRDVTERRLASFRELMESAPDAMV